MKRRTQLTLGLGLLALAPVALAQGAILRCLTWSPTATLRVQRQNPGADSDDPRRFAADDGADDDLLYALYYRAVAAAPGAGAATNAAKPHSDWYCALLTMLVMRPVWLNIYDHAVVPFENDQITLTDALSTAATPLKRFMLAQTDKKRWRKS